MYVWNLRAVAIAIALAIPAASQSPQPPVVALATGTSLTLATASGQIAQRIPLKRPVYAFALSRDRKLLATVAPDTQTGGSLSLLNLQTHTQTRLTTGHLYFQAKDLNKGETEVYDDPQFSPDGRSLAFAIHTDNPGDGNDAVMDSGPIAVMDLATRKVRVLHSTTKIDGQGPCFANDPMWSPDGKWILFNCEDGAFITDAQGAELRGLKWGTDRDASSYAVSWVGNGCVLYARVVDAAPGVHYYDAAEALLFNWHTGKSQSPKPLPGFAKRSVAGLQEASPSAVIRRTDKELAIETDEKTWSFPESMWTRSKPPAAHLLESWPSDHIPTGCE